MGYRAAVLKLAKRSLSNRQGQDERHPVLFPPQAVDHQLVGARSGTPLEPGCHGKQVLDGYLALQVIIRTRHVLGKETQDVLVNSFDKPLLDRYADQSGDKALGHRSDDMFVVLAETVVIPLVNKIACSNEEKGVDAAIAGFDFLVKVRQGLCAHSHRFRICAAPFLAGPIDFAQSFRVSRKGPVCEAGFCCRSTGEPWAMTLPPALPPPGPNSISQSQYDSTAGSCSITITEFP